MSHPGTTGLITVCPETSMNTAMRVRAILFSFELPTAPGTGVNTVIAESNPGPNLK